MTVDNILTLGMLILLQAVLGIDNLLYISLESKNAPVNKQKFVRRIGIGLAIFLRIALLFVLVKVIDYFQEPIFGFNSVDIISGEFNIHSLIVYVGGIFIIFTSLKEIWHMMSLNEHATEGKEECKSSTTKIIITIVIKNLVFSFDSILSAMALTDVMWVMTVAIVLGGLLMIWLAEKVSAFLQKNRIYEVLGLFILFLVGVMLLTEAGHMSHLKIFGEEITPMNKTTFYFIIAILVIIDVVQGRYQRRLMKIEKRRKGTQREN